MKFNVFVVRGLLKEIHQSAHPTCNRWCGNILFKTATIFYPLSLKADFLCDFFLGPFSHWSGSTDRERKSNENLQCATTRAGTGWISQRPGIIKHYFMDTVVMKYQDFSFYWKIISSWRAVTLFLSFTCERVGVAMVTSMINHLQDSFNVRYAAGSFQISFTKWLFKMAAKWLL